MELRTSLPEIFDEFGEARRQGFLTVKEIDLAIGTRGNYK